MKTLLLTLEFPPFKGGIANYYANLANHWPLEEKISVLNNNHGELLANDGFFPWRRAFGILKRTIKSQRIDYVLVGHILPLGTVTFILSWLLSFHYAVFFHGLDLSAALSRPRKKWLTGLILRRADKIICANSQTARQLQENFSFLEVASDKITLVNPGITKGAPFVSERAMADFRRDYNLEGKTVLLTVGRLVKRKGADQVIRALASLPPERALSFFYGLAGIGPDAKYLHGLVPPHLKNNIVFLGEISDEEKWTWFNLCDIFVMPAREINGDYEGFGIVYLEAGLAAKPVIAGRGGGVADAVQEGFNGLMVDPENLEEIKKAILALAADKDWRRQLGENGRQRALVEFNWEKQAAKLVSILKKDKIKNS